MSRESGSGPERGGTHSGGANAGGANSGGSHSSSGSNKGGGNGNQGSNNNHGSSTSKDNSGGLGNVGWGGGSKGPDLGGGSYHASTSFGHGDTGSSFGNFGGSGSGNGGNKGSSTPSRQSPSSPSMNFGQTSYTPTTQFGREAVGAFAGPSGGLPTGALTKVPAQLEKEYSILDNVKSFFTGLNPFADDPEEAAAGYSPMGGWASYGGAIPGMKNPEGFFSRLGTSFEKFGWGLQDAPLSTIANALSNPMMTAVGAFTGTLPAIAAVRAASAVNDVATGVSDMLTGAKELASTAVSATPLGSALGPMRGVVGGFLKSTEEGTKAIAGQVGGTVGSRVFGSLAMSLTDNPYAGAIATAAGGALSAAGLRTLATNEMGKPSSVGPQRVTEKSAGAEASKTMSSPLVASRENSQRLMEQGADPTKYIREMQLPFYGPQQTLNPYGFPNTMIGA